MTIQEILLDRLQAIHSGDSAGGVAAIRDAIQPDIGEIVQAFYAELLEIPEIRPILENALVRKNLPASLDRWLQRLFTPLTESDVQAMVDRQKEIGAIHANINVNLNYFNHGIGILKREIYARLENSDADPASLFNRFRIVSTTFDILVSIISESYFSKELVHETNELSLKVKGLTQNTAIECERLRSLLLDWLRNALTFLYQTDRIDPDNLPKLQHSNFGLWVIYKADFLSHPMDVSAELKQYIADIDNALIQAARFRMETDQNPFFTAVKGLNDTVTKVLWYIATIVDQALELDTGMDPLTRLFNRRYLNTILRRQTDISMKQGFPFCVMMLDLDHFKSVNDAYGHDNGDAVLKQFSEILLLSIRTSDFIFRYGGEEFLIVLGNVQVDDALQIAEKIRTKCESQEFRLSENRTVSMTCSIGIAAHNGHPDYNRLVKKADETLYRAKETGRNRVVRADWNETTST